MYYWNLLGLGKNNENITKQKVEEKYKEIKEKLLASYKPENPKLQSSINLLNIAYEYCKNDMNILIRNRIVQYSENPNSPTKVEKEDEKSALIIGRRRDIREIPAFRNKEIVKKFIAKGMNFNQLVPPEQNDKEIYYDMEKGKILSDTDPKTKTTVLLAKKKNTGRDREFIIMKLGIYNIKDQINNKPKQLTKYRVTSLDPNSMQDENIDLYGDIDLDKFEEDKEYKELFYKALERVRIQKDSYIGNLEENMIREDGVEKSAAKQLEARELGYKREEHTDQEDR